MRCGCRFCGTFMIQTEGEEPGCVCPECGAKCTDCMGTDTVVGRDALKYLADDPRFLPENIAASFAEDECDNYDLDGGSEI